MTLEAFDAMQPWIVGGAIVVVAALTFYSRWAILSGRGADLYRHPVGKVLLVGVTVVLAGASVARSVLGWGQPGNAFTVVLAALTVAVCVAVIVLVTRVRRTAPSE